MVGIHFFFGMHFYLCGMVDHVQSPYLGLIQEKLTKMYFFCTMEKQIQWGIIGIGSIAEKFAHDLAFVPDATLVAVASNSMDRAENFAKKHGAKFFFGSYEEIFSVPLDVVYIATPHHDHARCTQLCLDHGVGVLCEKPFAMNLAEVQGMVQKAREKNVFLMEALWTRFLPTTLQVLEWIAEGKIGEIRTIHADFGFNAESFDPNRRVLNKELGGGAFLDIGIYPAFISYLLLGYPERIAAVSTFGSTGVDMSTAFSYAYPSGATASLNCTFRTKTLTECHIFGTKGYIRMHGRFHEATQVTLFPNEGEPITKTFERLTHGYDFEAHEVGKCLQKNATESALWTLDHSLDLIKLLDQSRKAAGIHYPSDL